VSKKVPFTAATTAHIAESNAEEVAERMSTSELDWFPILLGLFGGLALFLVGMDQMTDALKALAGHRLQRVLAALSGNRVSGALTGAVSTAALQSSTITTVLTVGFVSAELLTLRQAAGVIIGANLGATVTAQLIALNVTELSLALIAVGAVFWLFIKNRTWQQSGRAIAALGFVFFGIKVMGDAMEPLATYPPVSELLTESPNLLLAVLAGAAITAVIRSSSATTGIVMVMAATGLIDLPTGIAIVLGSNIGTCGTAVIAAIGKGRDALRTAMVHVLVNVLGALFWLLFMSILVDLVQTISPSEVTSPRQLANAHTVFNAVNTVVFLLLLGPLLVLVRRIIPAPKLHVPQPQVGEFLVESATGTAALGLPGVRRELLGLSDQVRTFFDDGFRRLVVASGVSAFTEEELQERKDLVRDRRRAIVGYLGELSHSARDDEQSRQLLTAVGQADELAHVTDSLVSSFRRINRRQRRDRVELDDSAQASLMATQQVVSSDFAAALRGGREVPTDIEAMRDRVAAGLAERLVVTRDLDRYIIESDLLEVLARMTIAAQRLRELRHGVSPEETLR
jgi:phosphate:Na+ symporter